MLCLNGEEYLNSFYDGDGTGPSALEWARSCDVQYGAGAYLAMRKYWEAELPYPTAECPNHGLQEVVRTYPSLGADPYEIEVLACGDHVMDFSKDDVFIVKGNS